MSGRKAGTFTFAGSSAIHLLMVLGEVTMTHVTAHAHLALREMIHGTYARYFWASVALGLAGLAAPVAPLAGAAATVSSIISE